MQHSQEFLKLVEEAKKEIKELSIEDVQAKMDRKEKFKLVDTREDKEWAMNRIPGSIHIGKGVLERDIESTIPNKSDEIILYCGGGFRSALAAQSLQRMGYTNVYSMDEGIRGWINRGLPLDD